MTLRDLIDELQRLEALGFGAAPVVRENPATGTLLSVMTAGHVEAGAVVQRLSEGHEWSIASESGRQSVIVIK